MKNRTRLKGVHPDLVRVIECAATMPNCPPFAVIEGVRTKTRQAQLVKKGASKTMNSRHIPAANGYSHAVDIAPMIGGEISWAWPHFYPLAEFIKRAARECGIPIEWGGDWRNFKDGPHWQLPWRDYPGGARVVAHAEPMTDETEAGRLARSRTVGGAVMAGAGTGGMPLADLAEKIEPLSYYSDWIAGVFILLTVVGIATVLYARWDDAGRPLPWRKVAPE